MTAKKRAKNKQVLNVNHPGKSTNIPQEKYDLVSAKRAVPDAVPQRLRRVR